MFTHGALKLGASIIFVFLLSGIQYRRDGKLLLLAWLWLVVRYANFYHSAFAKQTGFPFTASVYQLP